MELPKSSLMMKNEEMQMQLFQKKRVTSEGFQVSLKLIEFKINKNIGTEYVNLIEYPLLINGPVRKSLSDSHAFQLN